MARVEESKIRREGFPINHTDAKHLLRFIDIYNQTHDAIEPELIIKLELLAGNYAISKINGG